MLVACGDSGTESDPDPTVAGSWFGTLGPTLSTLTLAITMNQQTDGSVSGSGSITQGMVVPFTISAGTHVFPNLSLTLTATGLEDMTLTGTVFSATEIDVAVTGAGFDFDMNLVKQ